MRIILPPLPIQTFAWTAAAAPPAIPLSTDASGPHKWMWTLAWKAFTASGTVMTPANQWDATVAAANGGGTLSVTAQSGVQSAAAKLKITGINPSASDITQFLATQTNGPDFNKILQHESHAKHFNIHGEPIESFDHGYGMCQLTKPKPTFVQVWNWKSNVQGGLALFASKRSEAITYLSQGKRTYTDDQLLYETVSRWNGGHYHEWTPQGWVRNPNILCDSKTGNMCWDITDKENAGKTEDALHKRDAPTYNKAPTKDAHWKYSGVCYADKILG